MFPCKEGCLGRAKSCILTLSTTWLLRVLRERGGDLLREGSESEGEGGQVASASGQRDYTPYHTPYHTCVVPNSTHYDVVRRLQDLY